MNPKVSVIIPTYNRKHTLGRAVQSVLSQSFESLEVLVIDDGSEDGTFEYVEDQFPSVRIYKQKNAGVSSARNLGLQLAQGEWVAFLDSDDEWLSHKLEKQFDLLAKKPSLNIIHGEEIWIRRGKRVNPKFKHKKSGGRIFKKCLPLCLISPSAVMMKKEILLQEEGFREDFPVCEDYELWLRLTAKYEVGFVETPIINKYGGHEDQLSMKLKAMDTYRVKAMQEAYQNLKLSQEEENALLKEVAYKSSILVKGFHKYEKYEESEKYAGIYEWASQILHGKSEREGVNS